jgi:cytochrome c2
VRPAILTLLAATSLIVAGCGAVARVTQGNPTNGKALFVSKCGGCHTLANAGTSGTIGPNLDNAFGPDKEQGFHISTITDVVRGQIAYPDTKPSTGIPGMTANLAHGQDAKDIAVYVALCSAEPKCQIPSGTYKIPN